MKKSSFVLAALIAGTVFADATVDRVITRQNWPWDGNVVIDYQLSGVTDPIDVTVRFFDGAKELSYDKSALRGDVYGVSEGGFKRMTLDPVKAFGTSKKAFPDFKAELTVGTSSEESKEVLYKVIDLATGVIEDITRGALLNGTYGSVETSFSAIGPGFNTTLSDVVIWTGVTNNLAKYAGTHLVVRKIPAGTSKYYLVEAQRTAADNVNFTRDSYIGVFETTVKQMKMLDMASLKGTAYYQWDEKNFSQDLVPATGISTWCVCGVDHNGCGTPDPENAVYHADGSAVFLKNLMARVKDGSKKLIPFTVPTQAEWQRAYRAGSYGYYYDGLGTPATKSDNEQAQRLGRYASNGGVLAPVGSYLPNAYGLYDMFGNAAEMCRDVYSGNQGWYGNSMLSGDDPIRDTKADYIPLCVPGGSYATSAVADYFGDCSRRMDNHTDGKYDSGFRVFFLASEVADVTAE